MILLLTHKLYIKKTFLGDKMPPVKKISYFSRVHAWPKLNPIMFYSCFRSITLFFYSYDNASEKAPCKRKMYFPLQNTSERGFSFILAVDLGKWQNKIHQKGIALGMCPNRVGICLSPSWQSFSWSEFHVISHDNCPDTFLWSFLGWKNINWSVFLFLIMWE